MSPVAYTTSNAPSKPKPKMRASPTPSAAESKQAALDDLTRRIRDTSDRLQRALSPFADRMKNFAESRPVIFTYAAIFVGLSCIPAACTFAFIAVVSTIFIGVAVFLLCLSIVGVVVMAMTFLVPVLIMTASLSGMAVGFLLALFLVHRLYLHIRSAGEHVSGLGAVVAGLQSWMDETLGRIGLGQSDYAYMPTFTGRTVDYNPSYKYDNAADPIKGEIKDRREYKYPIGQQQRRDHRSSDYQHSKVSPQFKNEPLDVRDVFSPESVSPNELQELHSHASQSQIYDDDWVSDDGTGAGR